VKTNKKIMVSKTRKSQTEDEVVEHIEFPIETLNLINLYKESAYDIISRSIYLWGEINEESSYHFITSVNSILNVSRNLTEPIRLYINSPGGDIYDMFSIIDYMQYIHKNFGIKIDVLGSGKLMSAGAFITITATGKRQVMKNTTILLHEVQSFSPYDNTTNKKEELQHTLDLENRIIRELALNILRNKKNISDVLIDKEILKIKKEIERKDRIIYPDEALRMGLIDEIL
jgi:ATP-dependent protease ClpP protease subunit